MNVWLDCEIRVNAASDPLDLFTVFTLSRSLPNTDDFNRFAKPAVSFPVDYSYYETHNTRKSFSVFHVTAPPRGEEMRILCAKAGWGIKCSHILNQYRNFALRRFPLIATWSVMWWCCGVNVQPQKSLQYEEPSLKLFQKSELTDQNLRSRSLWWICVIIRFQYLHVNTDTNLFKYWTLLIMWAIV